MDEKNAKGTTTQPSSNPRSYNRLDGDYSSDVSLTDMKSPTSATPIYTQRGGAHGKGEDADILDMQVGLAR
jgi:hypothetical protein